MKYPLATKAAKGRSTPVTAELLVNMYAEAAPDGARNPVTAIGCPGLRLFSELPDDNIRGVYYVAGNGTLWVVAGLALYKITASGAFSSIGTIGGYGRVSMADNGVEMIIVTEAIAYVLTLASDTLTAVTDSDYPNADTVAALGGYFFFNNNQSGSRGQMFWSAAYDGGSYDALDFATAENASDNLVAVHRDHDRLLLFGTHTIESWFLTGDDTIVAPYKGATINYGLGARWSRADVDNSVIFLDSSGVVRRIAGQGGSVAQRISTHAVENQIAQGAWRHDDAAAYDGAVASSYIEEGHEFYIVAVPSAGTFVFDAATGLWHQRKSRFLEHSRASFHVRAFNKVISADIHIGRLYEQSLSYNDEAGEYLIAEIQFPQIHNNNNRFIVNKLELNIENGVGLSEAEINQQYLGPTSCNINGEWATQASAADNAWTGITYGNEFVAVGGAVSPNVMHSQDGESWEPSVVGTTDLTAIEYTGDSLQYITGSQTALYDAVFVDNGNKLFFLYNNSSASADIVRFDCATPYTLAGATYVSSADVWSDFAQSLAIHVRDDGGSLYIVGSGTSYTIAMYSMSTPWDITELTLEDTYNAIPTTSGGEQDVEFRPDGLKYYLNNVGAGIVYQFSMSSAWDITTSSYDSVSANLKTLTGAGAQAVSFCINPSGTKMLGFFRNTTSADLRQFSFGTAWDLSTLTYDSVAHLSLTVGSYVHGWSSVVFAENDTTVIATDVGGPVLPTASPEQTAYKFILGDPIDIKDVAHSGSVYAAVGSDGAGYAQSPVIWNVGDLNDVDAWVGVCWFSLISKFVAVASSGTGNLVATSPDGETWTEQVETTGFNAVAASPTSCVMVGANGIKRTLNGTSFTTITEPADRNWTGVAYSALRATWVAVCDDGTGERAAFSLDDGETWQTATTPADYDWQSVSFGGGYFVAVADSGTGERIMRSQDGIDWELYTSAADNEWNDLAWSESLCMFAAVSDSGTGNRVMTSAKATAADETDAGAHYAAAAENPEITLDVSSTGGRSFDVTQPFRELGKEGEFKKRIIWRRLGQHRTFTPRFTISAPVKRIVFDATAEITPNAS